MWSRHEFLGHREWTVVGGITLPVPSRGTCPTLLSYIRNKNNFAYRIEVMDIQIEKLSWALQSSRGRQKSVKKKRQKKKRQNRFEA